MGPQPCFLVNTSIFILIELHITTAFPFLSLTEIIARPFWQTRRLPSTWNEYTSIITKQIQRIGTKRNSRQSMRMATQSTDEIAVGHHPTDTTVVFVKNRRANHDAMLHRIGKIKLLFGTINNSVNIGFRIKVFIQDQSFFVKWRLRRRTVAVCGVTDVVLRKNMI